VERHNGAPVIPFSKLTKFIDSVSIVYARYGFVVSTLVHGPEVHRFSITTPMGTPLHITELPTPDDLQNLDHYNCVESLRFPQSVSTIELEGIYTNFKNILRVYFVRSLFDDFSLNAWSAFDASPKPKVNPGDKHENSIFVAVDAQTSNTLAHEIAHMMLNDGRHANPVLDSVAQFKLESAPFPHLLNLMHAGGTNNTVGFTGERYLWNMGSQKASQPNQISGILASRFAQTSTPNS
jgi:hypothetical protein